MKIKYVIFSPRQKWGGAIVLHVLCKCLMDLGYDAKILYYGKCKCNPGLFNKMKFWIKYIKYTLKDVITCLMARISKNDSAKYNGYKYETIKGCKRKIFPFVDKNTVVVYGDNIFGNPLGGSKVIRYLLYYYQFKDDINAYGKNDIFIAYRDVFNDPELNTNNIILYIPFFDFDFYKRTNFNNRSGNCYIIRKGSKRSDLPNELDGPVIDNLSENQKVEMFNKYEYCISYDVETAYSYLAALCGCKSILMPELNKTVEDYRNKDPRFGVAIGKTKEEIDYAVNTLDKLKEKYIRLNNDSKVKVKYFAEFCEKTFSNGEAVF